MELSTLKNNNARLTSALQESTANVEEWKRQLHSYKEENTRLKVGLIELEAGRGEEYPFTWKFSCDFFFLRDTALLPEPLLLQQSCLYVYGFLSRSSKMRSETGEKGILLGNLNSDT